MKWFINSMLGFWILLLAVSLGAAAVVYEIWLKGNVQGRLVMKGMVSIGSNVILYAFLVWLLYDSTIHEWDPWFAFVVGFVLVLAVAVSMIPGLHAKGVSPGHYPEDE